MQHDIEIRTVAQKWIDRYHEDALVQVKQRLDELKSAGAQDAYRLWLQIYDEAESLLLLEQAEH